LFTNVSAGIGILGQASPMMQEMFAKSAPAAAGFVGLLSLFNLVGRFAWSSLSDRIGRKRTYAVYLGLGIVLYALVPRAKSFGSVAMFVACTCVILSMYGGGFATVPAYLRDLFGTKEVGAIHGRLLTAWSTAALVGPSIVTYAREYQIGRGVAKADAYSMTMYGLAALLVIGFACNARLPAHPAYETPRRAATASAVVADGRHPIARLVLYWAVVGVPLAWAVAQVIVKSLGLFR
jgi:MFS family permease